MNSKKCGSNDTDWKLEIIEIPDPCRVPWDSMKGTDTVRFCMHCEKNVYNISGMSESKAKQLLISSEGTVCISMLKRADGTIVSDACPRILRPVRDGFKRLAAGLAALIAVTVSFLPANADEEKKNDGKPCPSQPQRLGGAPMPMRVADPAPKITLDKELLKKTKITEKQAEETARKEIPDGKMESCELERENGKLVYSFDFAVKGGVKEVQVDALSGKVVSVKFESPEDEAKEKLQEAKEKAAADKKDAVNKDKQAQAKHKDSDKSKK